MTADKEQMIVSVDIGTSKVVVLIAEISSFGKMYIKGLGTCPSVGLRKGAVINIESTMQAITKAVQEAENMANYKIHSAHVGIAGSHINSVNSHGIVAVKDKEVTVKDINKVIDAAKAVIIPADQRTLHILPQEYVVDEQVEIREPLGMAGVRLEAWVHLITCASNAAKNIERCVNLCNLKIENMVLEQLASSYAVLTDDEKELGVCLVDIGGGTTDIAVFTKGAIRYTATIPIAGDHVTNDIAIALRIPVNHAEEIKIKYACVTSKSINDKDVIKISNHNDKRLKEVSRRFLVSVVKPRYEEIFSLIKRELLKSGFEDQLVSGIVLTGGTSKMEGAVAMASNIFNMPTRLGVPLETLGMNELLSNPIYATGVGLLQYSYNLQQGSDIKTRNQPSKGIFRYLRCWFQENF
ncbi:MAG: cell division protein FtsA [Endozoicomonadaceae bacterium]|nr:cell division protein FtsA [Endozoicomonadaceae bacterium]MCY4330332.1 cell division protein FtsA [Endozoicomonadaceae bacterium]